MLQKNTFFSQGSIFFGPQQQAEDEDVEKFESEDAIFPEFFLGAEITDEPIGLYIDWSCYDEMYES